MEDNKPDPFSGLDRMLLNPKRQQPPSATQTADRQPVPPKKERTRSTNPASKKDSDHDSKIASYQDSTLDSMIDGVRKAVRVRGNEQSIHRLSREEKRAVKDLVYEYDKDGVRTSENEVTRIALNWLIVDHKERGEESILARVLSAMND